MLFRPLAATEPGARAHAERCVACVVCLCLRARASAGGRGATNRLLAATAPGRRVHSGVWRVVCGVWRVVCGVCGVCPCLRESAACVEVLSGLLAGTQPGRQAHAERYVASAVRRWLRTGVQAQGRGGGLQQLLAAVPVLHSRDRQRVMCVMCMRKVSPWRLFAVCICYV